jgi:two-component system sensor histidine kinase VicK
MASPALQDLRARLHDLLDKVQVDDLAGQVEDIWAVMEQVEADCEHGSAEVVDDMAFFISHTAQELQSPMAHIRENLDGLIQMGGLDELQQQYVDGMQTYTLRMERLLMDVRFIDKIRQQNVQLNAKLDMFKNVALRLATSMQPLADEYMKTLVFEVAEGLPLLNVDTELLVVALERFVENAILYTSDGGTVVVRGMVEGATVLIEIEDDGVGMADADKARAGDLYFRSDDAHVRQLVGSGLGIPVAYGLLDAIGATVELDSTLGEGTKVSVRLAGMT